MSKGSLLAGVLDDLLPKRITGEVLLAAESGADTCGLWAELEELGLTLPGVAEQLGGQGGTLDDETTILRAAGRYALPLPLAETGFLAGWLLAASGLRVPPGRLTVAPTAAGAALRVVSRGGTPVLQGRASRVPWASSASALVAAAEDGAGTTHVVRVAMSACRLTAGRNLAGEPRDEVVLDDVPVEDSAPAPPGVDLDGLMLRGAFARSVMIVGALEAARDHAIDHATGREQFGRPIASLQAVQSLIAVAARDTAVARAAVELAVDTARRDGGRVPWLETAVAKVVCARAADTVARNVHQVHGAIGVTKEHPLQFVTRRLWAWREEFGTPTEWARRLGEHALTDHRSLWALVSRPSLDPRDPAAPS